MSIEIGMRNVSMERFDYVASGRLALWDTFEQHRRPFLDKLRDVLRPHAGASLEIEDGNVFPSDEPQVVALASVLDKLVSRGNPTLVALDFEQHLLSSLTSLKTEDLLERSNGRVVGRGFVSSAVRGCL